MHLALSDKSWSHARRHEYFLFGYSIITAATRAWQGYLKNWAEVVDKVWASDHQCTDQEMPFATSCYGIKTFMWFRSTYLFVGLEIYFLWTCQALHDLRLEVVLIPAEHKQEGAMRPKYCARSRVSSLCQRQSPTVMINVHLDPGSLWHMSNSIWALSFRSTLE